MISDHISDVTPPKMKILNVVVPILKTLKVKAPNIAHLSLLTSIRYNKKETKLKKCVQPNKVTILYYLHQVQSEKYFPDL